MNYRPKDQRYENHYRMWYDMDIIGLFLTVYSNFHGTMDEWMRRSGYKLCFMIEEMAMLSINHAVLNHHLELKMELARERKQWFGYPCVTIDRRQPKVHK